MPPMKPDHASEASTELPANSIADRFANAAREHGPSVIATAAIGYGAGRAVEATIGFLRKQATEKAESTARGLFASVLRLGR